MPKFLVDTASTEMIGYPNLSNKYILAFISRIPKYKD
jgi:hypothetical protein